MGFSEVEDWLDQHSEEFPLVPPHEFTLDKYPEGIGVQVCIDEKARLTALINEYDFHVHFKKYLRRRGVCVMRFLDEKPFERELSTFEAPRVDNTRSVPFHLDIKTLRPDRNVFFEQWASGIQGLCQNPGPYRKGIDTLIAPVICVASTLDSILDPEFSVLEPDFLDQFSKGLAEELGLIADDCDFASAVVTSYSCFTEGNFDEESYLNLEKLNQYIFRATPQVIRITWDKPALCSGGLAVLWDIGEEGKNGRPLAHARDNKGTILPSNQPNLYKINPVSFIPKTP